MSHWLSKKARTSPIGTRTFPRNAEDASRPKACMSPEAAAPSVELRRASAPLTISLDLRLSQALFGRPQNENAWSREVDRMPVKSRVSCHQQRHQIDHVQNQRV